MKALASDFDGTLYFEGDHMHECDLQAIRTFQQQGHLFGVCTGRPLVGIQKPTKERIQYDFYILTSGAIILDKNLKPIYKCCMDKDIMKRLYLEFQDECHISIQAHHIVYSFQTRVDIDMHQEVIQSPDEVLVDDIYGMSFEAKDEDQAKAICQKIYQEFAQEVDAYQNTRYVDIVAKGCSKGNAIRKLRELKHIDVIGGIGDSYNDIPMLKSVDKAFTFHRSPKAVQDQADYLVDYVKDAIAMM